MTVALHRRKPLPEYPLFDLLERERTKMNSSGAEAFHRQSKPQFPGPSYVQEFDQIRLTGLQWEVFSLMRDEKWRTHTEIKAAIGRGSENGIAAMLRGLRHKKNGKHFVDKRRRGDPDLGLWEYKLSVNLGTRVCLKSSKK